MSKIIQLIAVLLVAVLAASSVFANNTTNVELDYIKINGDTVESGDTLRVEAGETLNIRAKIQARSDITDIEGSAQIVGYKYASKQAIADFDSIQELDEGDSDYIDLTVTLPYDMDKEKYDLRIEIEGRRGEAYVNALFPLNIQAPSDAVMIKDVVFSPAGSVVAGRALLAQVRLENIGDNTQDDVKITAMIPRLGVEASIFMDELEGQDDGAEKKTSEELYLRIPACAKEGVYDVEFEVEFDRYETVTTTEQIYISAGDSCPQARPVETQKGTLVVSQIPVQDVKAGVTSSFPVVLQNNADVTKTALISVVGTEGWATAQVSEQSPVIAAGQTKVVYVTVTPTATAQAGLKTFIVNLVVDGESKSLTGQANVVATQTDSTTQRSWLEIGLIVLVVLIIILGFIVVLAKLKEKDEDSDNKGQTYY